MQQCKSLAVVGLIELDKMGQFAWLCHTTVFDFNLTLALRTYVQDSIQDMSKYQETASADTCRLMELTASSELLLLKTMSSGL